MEVKNIKIKSHLRTEKRNTAKERLNHMTQKKYLDRQSTYRTFGRLERKFEYDYRFQESKTMRQMKKEFLHNTLGYLGNGMWTKKLGRKDKYERNEEFGRPLKKNPFFKIFTKIENKIDKDAKSEFFQLIKEKFAN